MLVEDYIRPAAVRAGVITVTNGITYDRDGEVVKRFGFHVLGRPLSCYIPDGRARESGCGSGAHAPSKDGHDALLQPQSS